MGSRFDTPRWHAAVAALVRGGDGRRQADSLIEAISCAVDHEGTCLLAFHRDAAPDILHHTLDPEGARHYLDRYVAGPYLLDPLYQLSLRQRQPGVCRFRDESPDRFRSSEYYRQYCERTHLLDEMDFILPADRNSALALVVGKRTKMFTKTELGRLERIAELVHASMHNVWDRWVESREARAGDTTVHERLTRAFNDFGSGILTRREREISKLLLRGHSSKSIARELSIAPGTVMVHKRNLFAKLGITSQYALFSLFIEELSGF